MTDSDDVAALLRRVESLAARIESVAPGSTDGEESLVVQTVTVSSYPTVAQRFYAVQAVEVGGSETENTAGSFGTPGGTFYALNLGSAVPSSGTKLIVRRVDGYWVFRY